MTAECVEERPILEAVVIPAELEAEELNIPEESVERVEPGGGCH